MYCILHVFPHITHLGLKTAAALHLKLEDFTLSTKKTFWSVSSSSLIFLGWHIPCPRNQISGAGDSTECFISRLPCTQTATPLVVKIFLMTYYSISLYSRWHALSISKFLFLEWSAFLVMAPIWPHLDM